MIKKRCLLSIVSVLTVFMLVGCGKNDSQKNDVSSSVSTVQSDVLTSAETAATGKNIEIQPVNMEELMKSENLMGDFMGADGIELNYADDNRIVFHSFAGLFIFDREGEDWKLAHTLDLASLGANLTQGDNASLIWADRDEALIMPRRYAPDNDNPITYRYVFSENKLEETDGFKEQEDLALKWSYSEEGAKLVEQIYTKMQQKKLLCSNLYPIGGTDTDLYGFVAVGSEGLNSLQYGCFDVNTDRLEVKTITVQ